MFTNIRGIKKKLRISLKILSLAWGIIAKKKIGFIVISLVCAHFFYTLSIMEVYFEFQVYLFSNGSDMTKCQFLHHGYRNTSPETAEIKILDPSKLEVFDDDKLQIAKIKVYVFS